MCSYNSIVYYVRVYYVHMHKPNTTNLLIHENIIPQKFLLYKAVSVEHIQLENQNVT